MKKRFRVISDKRCDLRYYRTKGGSLVRLDCPGLIAHHNKGLCKCLLYNTDDDEGWLRNDPISGRPIRSKACLATSFDAYIEVPE